VAWGAKGSRVLPIILNKWTSQLKAISLRRAKSGNGHPTSFDQTNRLVLMPFTTHVQFAIDAGQF